jgi:hypothetical protein
VLRTLSIISNNAAYFFPPSLPLYSPPSLPCSRSRQLKGIETFLFGKVTEYGNIWHGHGMRTKFERGNDDLEKLRGQINSKKEKTMINVTRLAIVIFTALFCYTGVAQAQWVFLGRKAMGVVNRLTSQGHEGEP